jgi:hypothetical protein
MSSIYNTDYREINVQYLLKSLYEYKILFLTITISFTLFASLYVNSIQPLYKSEGLLKIGFYQELDNNRFLSKPLDSAADLKSKLLFVFLGRSEDDGWIDKIEVENDDRSNTEEYIRIESLGTSPEGSSRAIKNLVGYVQTQHEAKLNSKRDLLKITLEIINAEVDAIGSKQDTILSDEKSYKKEEFGSLIKNIKLMSLMDEDLEISYIAEQLRKKQFIEHFLSDGYNENSSLVSPIYSPKNPVSPNKLLITVLGFLVGILFAIGLIFSIKILSDKQTY